MALSPVRYGRVVLPLQMMSLRRAFKSCAGGSLYVGKPKSDPTVRDNRIAVWYPNPDAADGWSPAFDQPFKINDGGYVLLDGEPVQLCVKERYSIALYDANGVEEFYCSDYLPELLQAEEDDSDATSSIMSQDVMWMDRSKGLKSELPGPVNHDALNEIPASVGGLWHLAPFAPSPPSMGFPNDECSPCAVFHLSGGAFAAQLLFGRKDLTWEAAAFFRTGYTHADGTQNTWNNWVPVIP